LAVRILVLGASGMVGQGALRECLAADDVDAVVSLGRRASGSVHPKLRELLLPDLFDLRPVEPELHGLDACFFCAGVSAVGMSEADYAEVTFHLTLGVARTLVRLNPAFTLIYVSGAGTDSSERGRTMWARVKGATENALLALPCQSYMFRPALVRPVDGIVSRTRLYRVFYRLANPLLPWLERHLPRYVTSTRQVGRAMLAIARHGAARRVLESAAINAL
jgi:uncharacterized protein YbjT (DUF2867 family)